MKPPSRVNLVQLVVTTCVLAGCTQSPPWPPRVPDDLYRSANEGWHDSTSDEPQIRIAGARLARSGLYLDLLVHFDPSVSRTRQRSWSAAIGTSLSSHQDPSQFIELEDREGRSVELLPMRRALVWRAGKRGGPPTQWLTETTTIQVCMFRTRGQLAPGQYRVRLREAIAPGDFYAPPGIRDTAWQAWQVIYIDWPHSHSPRHPPGGGPSRVSSRPERLLRAGHSAGSCR